VMWMDRAEEELMLMLMGFIVPYLIAYALHT